MQTQGPGQDDWSKEAYLPITPSNLQNVLEIGYPHNGQMPGSFICLKSTLCQSWVCPLSGSWTHLQGQEKMGPMYSKFLTKPTL